MSAVLLVLLALLLRAWRRERLRWRAEVLGWARIYRVEPLPGESAGELLVRVADKVRAARSRPSA